jgi:hypothetical protein
LEIDARAGFSRTAAVEWGGGGVRGVVAQQTARVRKPPYPAFIVSRPTFASTGTRP